MATSAGEALAICVAELVQEDPVSNRTRLAHGHSIAKPHGPGSGSELVTAGEEKHEHGNPSAAQGSQRWRALDKLLRTSFANISPAYLFNSFFDID
jgi:hypothetical protein